MDRDVLQVKVDLQEPHKEKFLELVNHWSFTTYTETIRYMITENWEQEIAHNSTYLNIKQELIDQLHVFAKRDDIREKYYAYSVPDLANKAIELFLDQIKSQRQSLFAWDVRSKLSDDELKVTEVIATIQESRDSRDFTFAMAIKALGWRNEQRLHDILGRFEREGLVQSLIIDKTRYFHAQPPSN